MKLSIVFFDAESIHARLVNELNATVTLTSLTKQNVYRINSDAFFSDGTDIIIQSGYRRVRVPQGNVQSFTVEKLA